MKGYKGMNKDMTCRGMHFEVGKTYKITGKLELCKNGLHFCKNLNDVFLYYTQDKSRFFEVEAKGLVISSNEKSVTDELSIIRELSDIEVNRYKYGDGDGFGSGYGFGDGSGYGSGDGFGFGNSRGSGFGCGYGFSNGCGSGDSCSIGFYFGYGDSNGTGLGAGCGCGNSYNRSINKILLYRKENL